MLFILFIILLIIVIFILRPPSYTLYNPKLPIICNTPIVIFYHVVELNNWEKIFIEQINLIKKVGLYNKCKCIYIGYLGNIQYIKPYLNNKIKLIYHSNNLKEWKFLL